MKKALLPQTDKAVHWSSLDGTTHVYLVHGQNSFHLLVIGGDKFTITYRTRINSTTDVKKPLLPIKSNVKGLREYEFQHSFSKTTVWMAIEFSKGGNRVNDLTKTFYGSLDKVVVNDEFLNTV